MKEIILQKLAELENSEKIKILYACESGSRAWGFPSPDSDFDVRFIYARSRDKYLSIAEMPDVVGLPVNEVLDIGGWDLKKTLTLFMKSNGPLYEWLQSPIVYRQDPAFIEELCSLMPAYFSLRSGGNHYLSMAHNTVRDDLQGKEVKLKRYFYALRSVLACQWIVQERSLPPMECGKLRVLIRENQIQKGIDDLSAQKKDAAESASIAPLGFLNEWLTDTLTHCREQMPLIPTQKKSPDELNTIFRKYVLS